MKIHPVTLKFHKEHKALEPLYREAHFKESMLTQKISITLYLFLYAIFGVLDFYVAPETKYIFWFIRYVFVCPYTIWLLSISKTEFFRKNDNLLLSIMLIAGGVGINLMILFAYPKVAYTYYAGSILVVIGINTFIRVRILWAFTGSWIVIITYEIIAVYINTPLNILISNNFFFLTAFFICLISGYLMERSFRRNFFLNYELDRKNREIENIVIERTKELHQTKEKYRELVESLNDLIFSLDDTGRFTYVSPVISMMFGYDPNEVHGRKIAKFVHADDVKKADEIITPSHSGNTAELRFRSKKGVYRWVKISTRVNNDLSSTLISCVLHDITNERKLEKQLRQAHKMEAIGTLAGGIAHDFNNILFPMIGYSELILTDLTDDDNPIKSQVTGIYNSALRAKELVKQILTFSRTQSSEELELVRIQPMIKEALVLLRATIPSSIEIVHEIDDKCGPILADPTHIHQIIINLVTNSFHSMEDNGGILKVEYKKVELSDQKADGETVNDNYAELTVTDQGVGMEKETVEKIFDPFFTTKEQGKGTGMGLSVVHGIVQAMDGIINVKSSPSKGTEFKICFPVSDDSPEFKVLPSEKEYRGGDEKILLVDDEPEIVEMEQQLLEYLGYDVTTTQSSINALEIFKSDPHKFHLIITDITMPLMSGYALIEKIREIRYDIPVLVCTGYNEIINDRLAEKYGIQGFLLKPVVMKDLAGKIRDILDADSR